MAPLKPLNTIVLGRSYGFYGALDWVPMMPRGTSVVFTVLEGATFKQFFAVNSTRSQKLCKENDTFASAVAICVS